MTESSGDRRKPGPLRLVSDKPASEVAAGRASFAYRVAEGSTRGAVTDLATNLLRIIRGAGKPAELTQQILRLAGDMEVYSQAFGHYPGAAEYEEWLAIREPRPDERSERERHDALETVIRGSLQVTASRIAGQLTQERAGASEMQNGLVAHHTWRDRVRKEQAALARVAPARKRRSAKAKSD